MEKDKALDYIGGNKHKATFKEKAGRTAVAAVLAVVGGFAVKEVAQDLVSKDGNATTIAVDTGNNTLQTSAPGLKEPLIVSRYSHEKGQIINVTWGSDTLSNFAANLIKATPSEGSPTAEKVLAGQNQAEIVTNTVSSDGAIEYGNPVEMKVPLDTNIAMLQLEEQPNGTKIEVIK
jgi:hypothetical protein